MKFTKIKTIGTGSFGSVYLIKYDKISDPFALKQMNKNDYESFENEISFLMKLDHPNIVPIKNYYETGKYLNIILPYAKNGTLETLIKKKQQIDKYLSHDDIRYITLAISNGINYLHNNRVIHCDIKPSNILLFGNKVIKICDFGVSKQLKTSHHKTFVGTSYYIAPEIINGTGYNNSIDYWGLGVIIYELISFKKPFTAKQYYSLLIKIIRMNYNINIIDKKYHKLVLNLLKENYNERYKHNDIVKFFSNVVSLPPINKY